MKTKILLTLFMVMLVASGCSLQVNTKKKQAVQPGGVFLSTDRGGNWQNISTVIKGEQGESLKGADISFLEIDPTDNKAIFIGTANSLYYTFNGPDYGWQKMLSAIGRLNALAVYPSNHCWIYASITNRLYKTTDCGRHWEYKLIEESTAPKVITAIAIHQTNNKRIYVGTAEGGLYVSDDYGDTWRIQKYFGSRILNFIVTPDEPELLYVVTKDKGIWRTTNAGEEYKKITQAVTDAKAAKEISNDCSENDFKAIAIDPVNPARLVYGTNCLFETTDHGDTWRAFKLLTRPQETKTEGIAISYQDPKKIFYITDATLYMTNDNGETWSTKDLPSSGITGEIYAEPTNADILYLTAEVKK